MCTRYRYADLERYGLWDHDLDIVHSACIMYQVRGTRYAAWIAHWSSRLGTHTQKLPMLMIGQSRSLYANLGIVPGTALAIIFSTNVPFLNFQKSKFGGMGVIGCPLACFYHHNIRCSRHSLHRLHMPPTTSALSRGLTDVYAIFSQTPDPEDSS